MHNIYRTYYEFLRIMPFLQIVIKDVVCWNTCKLYTFLLYSKNVYILHGQSVYLPKYWGQRLWGWEVHIYVYIYICIYIYRERVIISGHKWSTTQSAQISQKQVERNLYAVNKTMCPPGYHHRIYMYTNKMIHGGCKYLLKDAKTFIFIRKGKEYQNLSTIKHI